MSDWPVVILFKLTVQRVRAALRAARVENATLIILKLVGRAFDGTFLGHPVPYSVL